MLLILWYCRRMWQPIETAPKDGSWVLLSGGSIDYEWDGRTKPPMVVGQFDASDLSGRGRPVWYFAWYDLGYYGEYVSPTHWMPLPA